MGDQQTALLGNRFKEAFFIGDDTALIGALYKRESYVDHNQNLRTVIRVHCGMRRNLEHSCQIITHSMALMNMILDMG